MVTMIDDQLWLLLLVSMMIMVTKIIHLLFMIDY